MREIGVAIIGQTADLVPADQRLYALRDVTATVRLDPADRVQHHVEEDRRRADAIVLDVKVGDGAFMKSLDRARELAQAMIELGRQAGREVVCELTDMDQPLGHAVGNSLEIREAVETLRGEGPPDLAELTLGACGHLLALSDLGVDEEEGRRRAEETVSSGTALERYETWIRPRAATRTSRRFRSHRSSGSCPHRAVVTSSGSRQRQSASQRSTSGRSRGARTRSSITGPGVVCLAKRGDKVEEGELVGGGACRGRGQRCRSVEEVAACYRVADSSAAARADRPRSAPLGPLFKATLMPCPSFPKSRRSGRGWHRALSAAASNRFPSTIRG